LSLCVVVLYIFPEKLSTMLVQLQTACCSLDDFAMLSLPITAA